MLLSIKETRFSGVPPDTLPTLEALATSWWGSVPAENAFKELSGRSTLSSCGKLGRQSRWHALANCGLMEDHDRPLPTVSPQAIRAAARTIPEGIYDYSASPGFTFSLGADTLDAFTNESLAPALSPFNFDCASYKTENLVTFGAGDPERLRKVWLSVLAIPGCVLFNGVRGLADSAVWVMESTNDGVGGWRVLPKRRGDIRWFEPCLDVDLVGGLMCQV